MSGVLADQSWRQAGQRQIGLTKIARSHITNGQLLAGGTRRARPATPLKGEDMKSFKLRAVLTGVVITGTLLFASPAWATFPGANGRIAFAALPTPGAPGMQIYTIEATGTGLRQLTHLDGNATAPHWSPAG